jgi:hypothetical protein
MCVWPLRLYIGIYVVEVYLYTFSRRRNNNATEWKHMPVVQAQAGNMYIIFVLTHGMYASSVTMLRDAS